MLVMFSELVPFGAERRGLTEVDQHVRMTHGLHLPVTRNPMKSGRPRYTLAALRLSASEGHGKASTAHASRRDHLDLSMFFVFWFVAAAQTFTEQA